MAHFSLVDVRNHESIAAIDMDAEMLKDPEILDPETLTLRAIRRGVTLTLVPIESPTIVALHKLRKAYSNITEKPTRLFSDVTHRMDELIATVGLLFDEVEFIKVESRADLNNIINPHKDYEVKTTKYTILGDMLKEVLALEGATTKDVSQEEHVHTDACVSAGVCEHSAESH